MSDEVLSEQPEEDAVDLSTWTSPLDVFGFAIGRLCLKWSILEAAVRKLLLSVSRMPDDQRSEYIVRCFDFRDQLTAIRVGIVSTPVSPLIVEEIIETVDYIDNFLRPRRNRLVHDQWQDQPGSLDAQRIVVTPKVVKPQAHQKREVRIDGAPETLSGILTSAEVVGAHARYISRLTRLLDDPTGRNFRELLAKRPQRLPTPDQSEKQRPRGTSRPKQKRPPQSSEG